VGHAAARRRAHFGAVRVDRHLAPAEDIKPLLPGDSFDVFACLGAGDGVLRQEAGAGREGVGAVGGRLGEFEAGDLSEKLDRELDQDAGAVTAVGFGTRGAAVFEVFQRDQPVGHDGVRATAPDVGDHGDATRVRLVVGVVQAHRIGQRRKQHW
jgi:hypothetical protein